NIPALQWQNALETLPENHIINEYKHLMKRVEQMQIDKLIEANKQSIQAAPAVAAENNAEPVAPLCSFDDFTKVDMRVAEVLSCEKVEGSDKLLKFQVDLGFEQRTIFSGIAKSYPNPDELVGRKVIAVANFAPRKMAKFGMSEGMLLSASSGGKLFLLSVDSTAQNGSKVG
ncbi:MAG: methionine--tRNA ligase subunit beta, partial [Neisseriaceae bacterium]|nr:methionine--tRNA ligase subunit beta [Neisseriaceae bacterium]